MAMIEVSAPSCASWRSRVPYTLIFDLEMLQIKSGKLLDGRASGDLVGACRWMLASVDGGTELHFDVDVRTGRWWMNLPIPFATKVVEASFKTIMGWGREGTRADTWRARRVAFH
jgi:hypothetical protein